LILALPGAFSQDKYPNRPITYIVPVPPGTGTDLSVRLIAKEAEKFLGQPIVVVNRPGAALTIGTAAVASAKPDGYTIGFSGGPPLFLLLFWKKFLIMCCRKKHHSLCDCHLRKQPLDKFLSLLQHVECALKIRAIVQEFHAEVHVQNVPRFHPAVGGAVMCAGRVRPGEDRRAVPGLPRNSSCLRLTSDCMKAAISRSVFPGAMNPAPPVTKMFIMPP
jgi:hypothetical protein